MKNILFVFVLLLSVLGCAPELTVDKEDDEKRKEIKDSIHPFEPGNSDTIRLEEEK